MTDFKAYDKELKAAGYSFDGRDVRDASGNAVAGVGAYNAVWFKDAAVEAIVSKPKAQRKAKPIEVEPEELEMVRARNAEGHFIADDPATPDVNEAWIVKTVKKAVKKK